MKNAVSFSLQSTHSHWGHPPSVIASDGLNLARPTMNFVCLLSIEERKEVHIKAYYSSSKPWAPCYWHKRHEKPNACFKKFERNLLFATITHLSRNNNFTSSNIYEVVYWPNRIYNSYVFYILKYWLTTRLYCNFTTSKNRMSVGMKKTETFCK